MLQTHSHKYISLTIFKTMITLHDTPDLHLPHFTKYTNQFKKLVQKTSYT